MYASPNVIINRIKLYYGIIYHYFAHNEASSSVNCRQKLDKA